MKKSYVLATLITLASAALASACGGSEPSAQNAEASASAAASASAPAPDMTPEPAPTTSAAVDTPKPAPPAAPDILDTAKAAGNFNAFIAAVDAAGLTDTLRGPGPFTVFAPTDDAFKKIPKAQADKLMKDKDALARVLKFHVIAGKLMAADVIKLKDSDTAAGVKVKFKSKGADVMIDKAKITKSDITASNGVIHVIDTVIMPPPAPPTPAAKPAKK
jgi:uncharacterized surface protein with fasciclin (FAS1) repeats